MGFIIHGDLCWVTSGGELKSIENGYLVCENGLSAGVFEEIPEKYSGLEVRDYAGKLIIPGMVDLHIHAGQYPFRGTNMDEELLDWLRKYTFPEEGSYASSDYARKAYGIFAEQMRRSATTRACIFATVHREATLILMEELEKTGLITYVGKVNMDRDAPEYLLDESADMSAYNTFGWINDSARFLRTKPILTPRFVPCCSNELLNELREIVHTYDIPIQSHLSENPGEVELVKELMPDSLFYGDGYARFDLFGGNVKTIMAHCIYSVPEEVELMRANGVYVAHCPTSNMNLASGMAPIRRYIEKGLHIGLGSDVAAGETESIFTQIKTAIAISKMRARYIDQSEKPLTFPEAFALATVGGGSFFGKVGSFDEGYELDCLVLDDSVEPHPQPLTLPERLERSVYTGIDRTGLREKYVQGVRVL